MTHLRKTLFALCLATVSFTVAAQSNLARTINVTMSDAMRFSPALVKVKAGETIRVFVKNESKITHTFVLGTENQIKEHADMMKKMPSMTHSSANMVTLKPGQRGVVTWEFSKAGNINFACTVPGHLEAGMIGKINVAP